MGLRSEQKKHYSPIGLNVAGKKNIEGLLPDSIVSTVYGANPSLVQAATAGTKSEQDSAKSKLKRLLLEEFKKEAKPTPEFFGHFYALTKTINKALT